MSRLDVLQRQLAASLSGGEPAPDGCRGREVAWASWALVVKRRRAAAHLLRNTHGALGASWSDTFAAHARVYRPHGLLFHVDDAWAFARSQARASDAAVRRAAMTDLARLQRRYRRPGPGRVAPRRSVLLQIETIVRRWLGLV